MKVKFNMAIGMETEESGFVDVSSLGYTEGEWNDLDEDAKMKEAEGWAWNNGLSVWYEEEE